MRQPAWALALIVGLGVALVALPGGAAEKKVDAERIAKLIEKLGSDNFEEREQATKELEQIGPAALEALRKAARSGEVEVSKRAENLIRKAEEEIKKAERRAEAEKLLAAKKVHLVYKDTPVAEAVADFARKSGYPLQLDDPEKKLADRKVTLDTGEVTFWEAFDKFCAKAGLTEATWQGPPLPVPGGIQPLPPIRIRPIRINPVRPPQPAEKDPPAKEEKPADDKPVKEQAAAKGTVRAAVARPAQQPAVGQAGGGGAAQPIARPAIGPGVGAQQPGVITLKDGKPEAAPTCYAGAARIRALTDKQLFGGAPESEIVFGLEVRTEPKIQLQYIKGVTIEKVTDDQGQKLDQLVDAVPEGAPGVVPAFPGGAVPPAPAIRPAIAAVGIPFFGSGAHVHPVRLKKGAKESNSLKEVTGTVSVQVLTPPEAIITVEKLRKAVGETVKGKDGGYIKVLDVKEADGKLTVKVEMESPPEVIPGGQFGGVVQPGIRILPAPIPLPAPPVPAPPPPPQGGGFFQAQAAPPIQIQVGAAVGRVAAPFLGGSGLSVLDDKGQALKQVGGQSQGQFAGGKVTLQHTMIFELAKGQEPAKLVFSGSRTVSIDIPFTLKDVPVK